MDPNMATEIDPLSMYEYPSFNYHQLHYSYPYDVKLEQPNYVNNNIALSLNHPNVPLANDPPQNPPQTSENEAQAPNGHITDGETKVDTDVKPVFDLGKVKKETGKKSNYWSQKITDENFPFYACALCNVSYKLLRDLDSHLVDHKERLTSYDLRMKSKLKKKQLKKEQRKLKKLSKEVKLEVEIKPEDGYIGNEKAEDFINNSNSKVNDTVNNDNTLSKDIVDKVTEKVHELLNNAGTSEAVNSETSNDKVTENVDAVKNGETKVGDKEIEYNKDLEKIYKCSACQKQFSLSYYLKLHVRSHTDEKPYTCSECGQSFITASKLGRHNKRIHLAIKYQCRICYKIFTRFEYLTRHFDKKHAEDKLEGEPYDYNAILPYLKELEEQLREKAEKEAKPKTEALWDDWPEVDGAHFMQPDPQPSEDKKHFDTHVINHLDIVMEDVKVPVEQMETPEVEVKVEVEETRDDGDRGDATDAGEPDTGEPDTGDVKDESMSDEDYFPSNTWAEPPSMEPCPASPPRGRRPRPEGALTCKTCGKTISTASYMRIHMRTHTGEKPYKCYVCGRGFITSSKMHRHVLTHSETWEKDGAGVKVEGADVKEEDDPEGEEGKEGDDKKAAKKPRKKRVEKKKRDYQKRPHACEFCQKRFLHLEMLQVHKKCHDGESAVLKCYYCLEDVVDEAGLKEHEATHTGPKPFLCTLCGKGYKRRETMVYHRKNHKSEKKYICDICSKTFNAPCKLQRHIVSHRADKFVLRYECPVCAHMFNTKYHVQMHLATHQKEGLILEENRNDILAMVLQNARKIPKQGDAPSNLTDLIPADERSRVCNICGEVFQHFYYLEEHLKSHGSRIAIEDENKPEERKHVCQVCNKSFKLHYYLKLHSFTHTKEKPYICQQCGKGFITKGKLKRHLETHSGLKKYQCHICYKFFTRPSYLRIHVRTIHGNQDYNFRVGKEFGIAAPLNALSVMTQYSE